MYDVFMGLASIAMIAMAVGLIKPSLVLYWGEKKTRLRAVLTYMVLLVIFASIATAVMPEEVKAQRQMEKQIAEQKKAEEAAAKKGSQAQAAQGKPDLSNASPAFKAGYKAAEKVAGTSSVDTPIQELTPQQKSDVLRQANPEAIRVWNQQYPGQVTEDAILRHYQLATKAEADLQSAIASYQDAIKEEDIERSKLKSEEKKHLIVSLAGVSAKAMEHAGTTLLGNKEIEIMVGNASSSEYVMDKMDVYVVLQEAIFGKIVYCDKISLKGIKPGETKSVTVTTPVGHVISKNIAGYPKKVSQVGFLFNSTVVSY